MFDWPLALNVMSSKNFCVKEKSGKYISLGNAFLKNNSVYFWQCWVFVAAGRLSLVAVSGALLCTEVQGPLIAVVSLLAEHGPWARGLQWLQPPSSRAQTQ